MEIVGFFIVNKPVNVEGLSVVLAQVNARVIKDAINPPEFGLLDPPGRSAL